MALKIERRCAHAVLVLLVLTTIPGAHSLCAQSVRLAFPQVAAGGGLATVVYLTNPGTADFRGTLEIRADSGELLDVTVNGAPNAADLTLLVKPGEVQVLTIGRQGGAVPGHLVVRDLPDSSAVGPQIDGTLVFQFRQDGRLVESVGVAPSPLLGRSRFVGTRTSDANTGLALSNPYDSAVRVTVRALDASGQAVGSPATIDLEPRGHRAAFLPEILTGFPPEFTGSVELVADRPVPGVVLRQENFQLSSVQLSPVRSVYSLAITLENATALSGDMSLAEAGGAVSGQLNLAGSPAASVAQLSGTAGNGLLLAQAFLTRDGKLIGLTLSSSSAVSGDAQLAGIVVYQDLVAKTAVSGTFTATKK